MISKVLHLSILWHVGINLVLELLMLVEKTFSVGETVRCVL